MKVPWFRYSLRTLLVVVTVLACWLAWNVNIARQRKQAIARIVSEGGQVITWTDVANSSPKLRNWQSTRRLPWSLKLVRAEPVTFINVEGPSFTDARGNARLERLFPEAVITLRVQPAP
jgi:hypothetical protein